MILLGTVQSTQSSELEQRFRLSGVPVFLEPDFARKRQIALGEPNLPGPDLYRVHACLDEQAEEARRLFEDPDYVVQRPVDMEAFDAAMDRLGTAAERESRAQEASMNWLVGGMLLTVAIGVAFLALVSL